MRHATDLSKIDLATAALLVVDMQNAFCDPQGTLASDGADVGMIQEMIDPLAEVISACQRGGVQDFWSIQEHYDNDAARIRHRLRPHTLKRFRVPSLKGTWDAQIVDQLRPLVGETSEVFTKNRFGCFYNTQLENLLRMHGKDTLIVTGVDTNVCVETTVREAYMRDFDVIVLKDCVGGVHRDWHDVALKVWDRYIGAVISSSELLALLLERSNETTRTG
jgi:ureidoacrylate peracid hydrolase